MGARDDNNPPRRRLWRCLSRVLAAVAALAGGVLLVALSLVLDPPAELVRRASLSVVRRSLNHPGVHVGQLKITPLRRVELNELWLGPPEGYRLPLLSVRRLIAEYDVSQIASGRIRIKQILVDQPVIRVEQVDGKLNWLAFLDRLPPSAPREEKPLTEPTELTIDLDRAAVVDLGVYFDDATRRAVLDGFNLTASGTYAATGGHLDVTVGLQQRRAESPNLALRLEGPQALQAKLRTRLELRVRLQRLIPARADLALDLDVRSQELTGTPPGGGAAVTLEPIKLLTRLAVAFDQQRGQAALQRLRVSFNDHRLLDVRATAGEVFGGRGPVSVALERLSLPLDLLAPYVAALHPGAALGGRIEVERLRFEARQDRLTEPRLLEGELQLSDVRAASKREAIAVDGLNATAVFAARPGRPAPLAPGRILAGLPQLEDPVRPPPVRDRSAAVRRPRGRQGAPGQSATGAARDRPQLAVSGLVSLDRASVAGARLERLWLRFAGGAEQGGERAATGQALGGLATVAGRLGLRIGRVERQQPGVGTLSTGLALRLQGGGDLRARSYSLEQLRLQLDRLLAAQLSARLDGGIDHGRYQARLELSPVDLRTALGRLPSGLRARLGGLRVSGRVGLELAASGRVPGIGPGAPLARTLAAGGAQALLRSHCCATRGPLAGSRIDLGITLDQVAVRQPAPAERTAGSRGSGGPIALEGLGGRIDLGARQGQLTIGGELSLRSLRAPGGVALSSARIPLSLQLDPRRGALQLGLSAERLRQADLDVTGLSLKTGAEVAPSAELLAAHIDPRTAFGVDLALGLSAERLRQRGAGLRIDRLSLDSRVHGELPIGRLAGAGGGLSLPVPPARIDLRLGLGEVRAATPGNDVRLERLTTRLSLAHRPGETHPVRVELTGAIAALHQRQLGLVARGMTLGARGAAGGLAARLPPPPGALAPERVFSGPLAVEIDVRSLRQRGVIEPALKDNRLRLAARLGRGGRLELASLRLRAPTRGLRVDVSGHVHELAAVDLARGVPPFDLRLRAALDTPRARGVQQARFVAPGLHVGGKAGLSLRVRRAAPRRLRLSGRLIADRFDLWQRSAALARRDGGDFLRTETRLRLRNLNAEVPISQDLEVGTGTGPPLILPPPRRSIFDASARSGLYEPLLPFAAKRATLQLDGVQLRQQLTAMTSGGQLINSRRREIEVGKIALDLALADSALMLDRLYVDVFGGDIAGSVAVQLVDLAPLDARVGLRLQVTGVDLSHLDPARRDRRDETSEISTLVDLKYQLARRQVSGRVDITRLSLQQLDDLLAFLDPNNVNESVKRNRALINAWYMKLARIKLVAIWIDHSNLNMDIEVSTPAYFPAGPLLRWTLERNRIRRLNIVPRLPRP